MIFNTYLQLNSVHALVRQLEVQAIRSKARTTLAGRAIGGRPLDRGALYYLLRNRVYLGEVPHKHQSHPGLHDAIVDAGLFAAVQLRLDTNARRRKATGRSVAKSPLAGRIVDIDGQLMSPTFAYGRSDKLYRYYVSAPLQRGAKSASDDTAPRRVSATTLEARLLKAMTRLVPSLQEDPLKLASRIEVHAECVEVLLPLKLINKVNGNLVTGERAVPDPAEPEYLRLTLPWRMQTRGGRAEIVAGDQNVSQPDPSLIRALRAAHAMIEHSSKNGPILQASPTTPWRRQLVRLAFLAPDIQRAILEGRHPHTLTLAVLMKGEVPLLWADQHRRFGIETAG